MGDQNPMFHFLKNLAMSGDLLQERATTQGVAMAKVPILYYSSYGHIEAMARHMLVVGGA